MSENQYGTSNSQFGSGEMQQSYDDVQNTLPEEYKPIGMWAYFGYEILFSIPIIGWIFLLVFSFGATKNVNLRNFARSYFCLVIVAIVLILIVVGILVAAGLFGTGTTTYYVNY